MGLLVPEIKEAIANRGADWGSPGSPDQGGNRERASVLA